MATLVLSLIQSKVIEITAPQGVSFTFGFRFRQVIRDEAGEIVRDSKDVPTYELMDISDMTFLNQIRTKYFYEGGELVLEFTTTPAGGNVAVIDVEKSRIDFIVSAATAETLKPQHDYYFETKMLLASEAVRRVQAKIKIDPDIARVVVV